MLNLPDYVIGEQIHENSRIRIYKGYTRNGLLPVIIKMLKKEAANPLGIAGLMYEYEITRNLNIDGIVKPLGLEQSGSLFALIMEDVGAVSLRKYLQNYPVSLQRFLTIAIGLTEVISRLHQKAVIHRDLKPEHILIQPDTLQVYLIDFSNAVFFAAQEKNNLFPGNPVGSLEYMSPEQTGRLDIAIDQRSDLYSLGIVFYELLTGMLPFQAANPAEWIYAHLAQQPQPPIEVNAAIPRVISDIVMKLLAKAVENRYQSGYGLLCDLQECQTQLLQTGRLEFFPVGRFDLSPSLRPYQKLYGRTEEQNILKTAFAAVCEGRAETILLSGDPGVGKTVLVNESLKPLVLGKGYYLTGKFDQLEKNIPYAPFAVAFGNLIKQLMTESRQKLDWWKTRIRHAVGRNGAVITESIPELEWLIGKQPTVDDLSPKEAESRFLMVFIEFVKVFTRKGHPLVLFLDDLQWADHASINLLKYLTQDANLSSFLFVGAFRGNEVNTDHPLTEMLEAARQGQANYRYLTLLPLKLAETVTMVAELLNTDTESAAALAEDLYRKSGGNPFFLKQLLRLMYDEGLLYFDAQAGGWHWKLADIRQLQPGKDMLELILKKLQRLPAAAQEIIKLAACIGNRFELETLAAVSGKSSAETASCLLPLVQEGLVIPVKKLSRLTACPGTEQPVFEFIHDGVQQAAYAPITVAEKKQKHLIIGRLLLQNAAGGNLEEQILFIMDHFNRSLELIHDPQERMELAGYNLLAGRKAKAAAAYKAALKYFASGKVLLPDNAWEHAGDLCCNLYLELAQMEFLAGNIKTAEALFETVIDKAGNELERAGVYGLKVALYAGMGKYTEAVQTGIRALAKLGIRLPLHPTKFDYARELLLYKWYMRGKKIEDLLHLPAMQDPRQRKIAELLARLAAVTMNSYPDLYSFIIIKTGNHAVRYGNTPVAPVGFLGYSITTGSILGDYAAGEKYGMVSIQLAEEYGKSSCKCIAYFVMGSLISHWTQHATVGLEYLTKAVLTGVEAGDALVIGFAHCLLLENRYLVGMQLGKIAADSCKKGEIARKLKHENLAVNAVIYEKVTGILQGRKTASLAAGVAEWEEDELVQLVKKDRASLATYYIHKIMLCYMVGNFAEALAAAKQVEPLFGSIFGFLISAEYSFYYALTLIALFGKLPAQERGRYRRALVKHRRQLTKWAKFCKENFEHKYLLIAAETARLEGNKEQAMSLYDRAICSARENGYRQNEALANELAARFYLSQGRDKIARVYLTDAYHGYNQWGASAKAQDLKQQYPQLLKGIDTARCERDIVKILEKISKIAAPGKSVIAGSLDKYFIDSFIDKLITNIEQGTDINKLFASFLEIAAQSVGADKGCLVLEKNGELFIEAIKDSSSAVTVSKTVALEECNTVAKSVIRYVARTLETVVINQREQAGIFAGDPYIAAAKLNSVVCLPLLFQGILFGVLYLENSFIPGAFTPEKLATLKLLSTQIAYVQKLQSYLQEYQGNTDNAYCEIANASIAPLTERETEVLQLIAAGLSNKEIAERLDMTVNTVKTHIKNIYGKLQVNRRVQAVEKAKQLAIL